MTFLDTLTPEKVLFLLVSVWMILCASLMIIHRHPVYSAIFMVATMFGVAACFVLLDSYFLGVIQVLVYAGAVMVLFLFIIMLLNVDQDSMYEPSPSIPVIVLTALFAGHIWKIIIGEDIAAFVYGTSLFHQGGLFVGDVVGKLGIQDIAVVMLEQQWFAFEAISMLLLSAIVGAVVLSKRRLD